VDGDVAFVFCWNVFVSFFSHFTPLSPLRSRVNNLCRYVAMHAMQEDASHDHFSHSISNSNGYAEGGSGSQRKAPKPQMRDTLAAVGGMLIPLLTQLGHHH
jgi:hypothetical protein